ncbi:type II secretion system protein GspE [Candidatus Peregrinibacteria bacterium]|nr:type II secretion system protein GspE [Candidatus Peregrinibacteria bacterium]
MPEEQSKLKLLQDAILAGNIPQMVLNIISYALDVRSSDIHIEPEDNTVRIRYRVDGVLRQIVEYPHNIHPAVVSRVKIMSNLKIDEQRIPQDGRSTVTTKDNREMDLRISTLPTVRGEKIVMRIQDKSRKIPDLPELGLQGSALKFFEDALKLPNGIILTTGPTGSGKTTTMYSAMARLNKVDVNIMTIEDPVEIQMNGLNQSQVHPDIDYTFANGLRTALRQDPDIIMVGEIRDRETINIAIEASLTGHLVLSTIHTNSAVETLTRILNMGVPPFLLTASLELVIAQRLVRRLCENCKKPVQPDPEILELVKNAMDNLGSTDEIDQEKLKNLQFYGPEGCEECDGIGYKGRLGLYEIMRMNNELRKLILTGASAMEIEKAAIQNGMVTLEQIGIIKALKADTSLDEVYRVAKKMEMGPGKKSTKKKMENPEADSVEDVTESMKKEEPATEKPAKPAVSPPPKVKVEKVEQINNPAKPAPAPAPAPAPVAQTVQTEQAAQAEQAAQPAQQEQKTRQVQTAPSNAAPQVQSEGQRPLPSEN